MIEYDYLLKKDDGTKIAEFKPSFDTCISNVSTFRGHNSSGKSTFMDLVALSLYGTDSPDVISKLKEKLEHLKEADNSDFTFELTADNKNIVLKVRTIKEGFIEGNKNWSSVIEESIDGGKTFTKLTKEQFRNKFRVIYDMPDRPMERIQELVREAELVIRETTTDLNSFRYELSNEIRLSQDSRDESLIREINEELKEKEIEFQNTDEQLRRDTIKFTDISKYYYSSELKRLFEEKSSILTSIANLKKENRKNKRENSKQITNYENGLRVVKSYLRQMLDNYQLVLKNIADFCNDEDAYYILYKQYEDYSIDSIIAVDCNLYDFIKFSKEFATKLENENKNDLKDSLSEKKKLLYQLIVALEPYKTDNIHILNSSIDTLYSNLNEELQQIDNELGNYEQTQELIARINDSIRYANSAQKEYNSLGPKPDIDSDDEPGIAQALDKRNKTTQAKIDELLNQSFEMGIAEKNYEKIYSECQSNRNLIGYLNKSSTELYQIMKEYK